MEEKIAKKNVNGAAEMNESDDDDEDKESLEDEDEEELPSEGILISLDFIHCLNEYITLPIWDELN